MKDIMERVSKIFNVVFEKEDLEISEKTCADDIEGWDSYKHLTLLAMLEEEFRIKFEVDDIISMENVGDIVNIIKVKG